MSIYAQYCSRKEPSVEPATPENEVLQEEKEWQDELRWEHIVEERTPTEERPDETIL